MNDIVFGTCQRTLTSPETPMPETIKKCLKENLPKPWGEIKNATKEITWECPPKCKPPPEKMPDIQAALVAAFGQEIADKIKATFEQCKEQSQGNKTE